MKFPQTLQPATLIRRYKRFLADIEWPDGRTQTIHCANPGSMLGHSAPGSRILVSDSMNPKRKLRFSLEVIEADQAPVMVNTQRPNQVVAEALEQRAIPELGEYHAWQAEVAEGLSKSRLDFMLLKGTQKKPLKHYVEVKAVTCALPPIAYFPDAVTSRGVKHLKELRQLIKSGHKATMLFLVCRPDVTLVRPAKAIDPVYAQALKNAARAGVEVLAYDCHIDEQEISLRRPLPVQLHSKDLGPAPAPKKSKSKAGKRTKT